MIAQLALRDLDAICALEAAAFEMDMRASQSTYRARFALGHVMLGYRNNKRINGELAGIIGYSYGSFHPEDLTTLPDHFSNWSMQETIPDGNAAFIYNLGIAPSLRGTAITRDLVHAAIDKITTDGCRYIIAEGPVPSYAGNDHIARNPLITTALDRFAKENKMPDPDLLFTDPHLSLYRRFWPCSILCIKPDFIPADQASGGFRVMLFHQITD